MIDHGDDDLARRERRIALLQLHLRELGVHRSYLLRLGRSVRASLRTETAIMNELADLIEEQRYDEHRARFTGQERKPRW